MKRTSLILLSALTVLVAACGGTTAPSAEPTEGPKAFEAVTPGDALPEAELELLGEDGAVNTATWVGKPTIINFWATWCTFCIDEMPDLEAAHQRLGDDVRFVGVDREDPNIDKALELAEETGVTYELVRDPDASYFRAVKGRGMPLTVLVDEDGIIQFRHNGPLTEEQLLDLVDEHLGLSA
ncbi:MAG: TlpA disulfide reductase family protein [Nitriliruptorales bacterium]|nr:TlpA disulfide reductase family protein [Nitriliruptorales bacterium]